MRKLIVLLVVAAFAVTAAYAEKVEHPKTNLFPTSLNEQIGDRAYFEGFEGAFPPAGWTQGITNASYTWVQDGLTPFEGLYAAYIPWQVGVPQDETLSFSYTINSTADEDHLTFATEGSPYWSVNGNFTVEVNGTVVFDYSLDNQGGTFVWEQYDIDLSAYDGMTVDITFRYAGDDGADHYFDAVSIAEGIVIPDPPENDTCDGAILIPCGVIDVAGDTQYANADYPILDYATSCTGYTVSGNDVVYKLELPAGGDIDITYTCTYDNSFFISTDCADAEGTCVVGADATVTGVEQIVATLAPGTYYVIVSAYSSGAGPFTLTGTLTCGGSATEDASWGAVKTLFR